MNDKQVEDLASSGFYLRERLDGSVEETHISWVILTRHHAFKIKKPLKFSFLDFTTLPSRKKYCERELALNRRFSPIYLAVLPVRRSAKRWRIGPGAGKVVDYAVMMKRMRSSRRMDLLLASGGVGDASILSLAREIATFHRGAEVIHNRPDLRSLGKAFSDIRVITSFVSQVLPEYEDTIPNAIQWSDAFIRAHRERFRERVQAGFRRDVHGDLHSGNIFLYRHPVIFDCIEFNEDFRRIDVLDEVAFLCMDLEAHGQGRLSRVFLREYRHHFPCLQTREDWSIFTFYKCYRANVRAKVSALAAAGEEDPGKQRVLTTSVRRYLKLMKRYMG